jgi:methyltransferase (TIGR00027 family)
MGLEFREADRELRAVLAELCGLPHREAEPNPWTSRRPTSAPRRMLIAEGIRVRDEPSQTAEAVCLFRAAENSRSADTRMLEDPYAAHFLGPRSRAALAGLSASRWMGSRAERYVPGLTAFVVARHRWIDEKLAAALDAGAHQLVLLGAGYDTRAYRFASQLAGRPVFELDFPATSERKVRIASTLGGKLPDTRVEHVAIDFLSEKIEQKLLSAGFETGVQTFFVWEGVSMYLTRAAVKQTLATLHALAGPGSDLTMDFWYLLDDPSVAGTLHRSGPNFMHLMGEPFTLSVHPEDVGGLVGRLGYESVEITEAAELEARYVRDERRIYPAMYLLHARTR